jgi:nucleoside-diphosphate kinase
VETTLVVLKPDAIQRRLVGRLLARLEDCALDISGLRERTVDRPFVRRHYPELAETRGPEAMLLVEEYMTSGPVISCRVSGVSAIGACRRLIGPTIPAEAPPGTIRGDLCHTSEEGALRRGESVMNLIHASGNAEEAAYELALWYPEGWEI